MRKIQFRLWDGSAMHYGCCCSESGASPIFRLMQFTGIVDKNGSAIYEGDIVKIADEASEVEWIGSGFKVMRKHVIRNETRRSHMILDVLNLADAEVLGNKFENPELMTETTLSTTPGRR